MISTLVASVGSVRSLSSRRMDTNRRNWKSQTIRNMLLTALLISEFLLTNDGATHSGPC